jgi:hypothetical protein
MYQLIVEEVVSHIQVVEEVVSHIQVVEEVVSHIQVVEEVKHTQFVYRLLLVLHSYYKRYQLNLFLIHSCYKMPFLFHSINN